MSPNKPRGNQTRGIELSEAIPRGVQNSGKICEDGGVDHGDRHIGEQIPVQRKQGALGQSQARINSCHTAPYLPAKDFEGDPRISYGAVDMGTDEYHPHLYYTGHATPGGNVAIKFVGIPNEAVRLFISAGVTPTPLPTSYGAWRNAYGVQVP